MTKVVLTVLGVVGVGTALWMTPTLQRADRDDSNSGAYVYRTFCASCHGQTGKGDGPAAGTLVRQPTDLTTLSQRNGGVFPRADVIAVLDGSRRVPGHEEGGMPNWQDIFRRELRSERLVRERLERLASYIETLQAR
jgi:mono/diheme cytochrome c family protein